MNERRAAEGVGDGDKTADLWRSWHPIAVGIAALLLAVVPRSWYAHYARRGRKYSTTIYTRTIKYKQYVVIPVTIIDDGKH